VGIIVCAGGVVLDGGGVCVTRLVCCPVELAPAPAALVPVEVAGGGATEPAAGGTTGILLLGGSCVPLPHAAKHSRAPAQIFALRISLLRTDYGDKAYPLWP
jgi:hypothetical protein